MSHDALHAVPNWYLCPALHLLHAVCAPRGAQSNSGWGMHSNRTTGQPQDDAENERRANKPSHCRDDACRQACREMDAERTRFTAALNQSPKHSTNGAASARPWGAIEYFLAQPNFSGSEGPQLDFKCAWVQLPLNDWDVCSCRMSHDWCVGSLTLFLEVRVHPHDR